MDIKTINPYPKVSCICVTFARPDLLREAVESFIKQDYKGEKELIILNDFEEQTYEMTHPEIHIFNVKRKMNTLGEKRNAAAALARGEIYFPWDDDDISLPFRITQSVDNLIETQRHYYKPKTAFFWNNRKISSLDENNFHAECCYSRTLFMETGGYAAMGAGEDLDFDMRVERLLGEDISTKVEASNNYYLYRWGGTDSYHISALDKDTGEKEEYIRQKASAKLGLIKTGKITIEPYWNQDYFLVADQFLRGSFDTNLYSSRSA